jgi:hypothetical protein
MIHMLARAGARWEPEGRGINDARRALLKMRSDYTMEFIWIMSEYGACSKENVEKLMAKPTIRELVSRHAERLEQLMAFFLTARLFPDQHWPLR